MKLSDYLESLQQLVKDNPKALDYNLVYSSDDEGNYFRKVRYVPTAGTTIEGEFMTKEHYKEWNDGDDEGFKENAICIN